MRDGFDAGAIQPAHALPNTFEQRGCRHIATIALPWLDAA